MTTPQTTAGIAAQTVCLAIPLLPGRTDADRDAMASCWAGERRADHGASRRRHGITRESVWIQATPGGDVAVILLEARDLRGALEGLASSSDAFDVWFRRHVADVHGIDLAAGAPLPEQLFDFRG